jgi:hypothetical protein
MRQVTKNPPKMLIEAMMMAIKLKSEMMPKLLAEPRAIMAPTIITPEMAFVTDINGVWRAGVTFQTTK